jgi:RNA polymerase sigma factor (sigma-70 family)
MGVTDEALMRAVREGDLCQLATLFDRYHLVLFGFLSRITGSSHVAEDLVQEVFLRILKYRATYRDEARFETWIYRIARNARADYLAKRGREQPLGEEVNERADGRPGPEGEVELETNVALLQTALLQLREDRRELIVLARYQGMKYDAIAEVLGVDNGTVKVRVHRALKELRDTFLRLSGKPSCDAKTSQRSLSII